MTNLNTTPNPFGKHSFRDNAVDSAANQTYEFDIDGSVAASVENAAAAKPSKALARHHAQPEPAALRARS